VLEGQASTVSVLLSLEDSKRYSGLVGADGRFRVPVELPWRLLPASYEVSVSCAVEHGRAGLSGAALLGDRVLHVAKPVSAATTARGEPEPAALSASLRPGDTGQEVLLRGRGCYLSALRGSPGLVRIVVDPVLGDRPEELRSLLSSWRSPLRIEPAPDGSWRATLDDLGTDKEPSRPYDIYALCTDDLGGLGFVYTPVYRVEFDRIRAVSGRPA
jgi:hypothetical protein